jgi:hypothetical protein
MKRQAPSLDAANTKAARSCKTPNMTRRSYAEVVYHSYWLSRLGKLSEPNLVAALIRGDERGDVDASFDLEGVPSHDSEYDEGYWHTHDRIDGDVAKTMRMLAAAPDLLVCRLRIAAPPLPIADAPRPRKSYAFSKNQRFLFVTHTSSRQPGVAAAANKNL